MQYRTLGKTGWQVSEIGLGTWQVGGKWGSGFDAQNAQRILHEAVDHGVNFIDTADVYENRQSERAVGELIRSRKEKIYIATKCGRF
ncbi:MAG: aldo/keto reductase, partial [Bacteroidota bacterium]